MHRTLTAVQTSRTAMDSIRPCTDGLPTMSDQSANNPPKFSHDSPSRLHVTEFCRMTDLSWFKLAAHSFVQGLMTTV